MDGGNVVGTEIIIPIALLIWVLSIIFILYRMFITKRKVAFWSVVIGGICSIIPIFLITGPNIFLILQSEFIIALGIGIIALVYSQRWQLATLYNILGLIYIFQIIGINYIYKLPVVDLLFFIAGVGILTAPIFIALSIVFCVGAFWENRTSQTQNI
jgi:hypothetical protein